MWWVYCMSIIYLFWMVLTSGGNPDSVAFMMVIFLWLSCLAKWLITHFSVLWQGIMDKQEQPYHFHSSQEDK